MLAEFECEVAAAAEAGQAAPPEAGFDVRLEKAMRADALALFEKVMSAAGQAAPYGKPDVYRDVTVCCVLGYATYARAYYAPAAERRTRQMRRAD